MGKIMSNGKTEGDGKNEIIAHEWITLAALWRRITASPPANPTPKEQETIGLINALLIKYKDQDTRRRSAEVDWCDFNEAEQAVGSQLGPEQIETEYAILLQAAETLKLADIDAFVAAKAQTADAAVKIEVKREIYMRLLYRLQSFFVARRSGREFRRRAIHTLFWVGLVAGAFLVAWAIGVFFSLQNVLQPQCGLLGKAPPGSSTCITTADNHFGLLLGVVVFAGAMGACFSRALKFRSYADSIAFADFLTDYTLEIILLRMLYGAVGAMALFFLMRGGLVGGEMFPAFAADKQWAPEYAKLVLWSFLAGFSERLVPDLLEKTEARSKEKIGG
jgi:hypothetical protein